MNQQKKAGIIATRITAAAMGLSLMLTPVALFTGCDDTEPPEVTLPMGDSTKAPETLPDLTDDREPTDVSDYTDRLNTLFAETPVTPEADFTYEATEDGVTVTGYTGGEIVVVIPDTLGGEPVTAIGEGAFAGMTTLKALSVPDTVKKIGKGALKGCKELSSLRTPVYTGEDVPCFGAIFGAESYETNGAHVPANLRTLVITAGDPEGQNGDGLIPEYAFYACRGLEVVCLPATASALGDFAFYGCEALVYINTHETEIISVGQNAFTNCRALVNFSLPDTVLEMGASMLEGCGALETLTLPFVGGYSADLQYALTEEEKQAIKKGEMTDPVDTRYLGYLFGADTYSFTEGYIPASLMTVTLLEGCATIPANAFFECSSVRRFVLPESVTTVGRRAFYGCEALSEMTLPASVETVGDDAFSGCIRMVSFNGGKGLTELGIQTFMDCVSLTTVTLPETVTYLPNSCFSGCVSLTTLTAEGVTSRGKQVFRHCDKLTGWSETVVTAQP